MDVLARKMVVDSDDEFIHDLVLFEQTFKTATTFGELNKFQLREKLWDKLLSSLSDTASTSVNYKCLTTLRILSRDKMNLNELISIERLNIILHMAALVENGRQNNTKVTIEALKLLCNLIFNSTKVQQVLLTTTCLPLLIKQMENYDDTVPEKVVLFHIRIIFLITALNISARQIVKTELKGDECLIKILEYVKTHYIILKCPAMIACEVLKALFNLYINADDITQEEEKNKALVAKLRELLVADSRVRHELQSNIVNLLTVIPYNCYSALIPKAETMNTPNAVVFQNADMTAVQTLLMFLDRRLLCKVDLIANLSPILTAFIRMVKSERLLRKYTRLQILPPLKDVMHRPEEGDTIRGKLCKLLTSPLTEIRDLVAEFLFILCKENVNRMVKYAGYGNAAGMFANKGLLGPSKGKPAYSSESEDSETEEYLKHKEQINPVTGCYEQPKPNPLEGMTEEQKEYEALQLVGLVDKLTREGVVQPCRIGDDGKPKPIEHVLELQEELLKQQYCDQDSDSA